MMSTQWPDYGGMSDAELMKRSQHGDNPAYEELARRLKPPLFRFCMAFLRDRDKAEEATQEALVKGWLNKDEYDQEEGSVSGWFFGIVRNSCRHLIPRRPVVALDAPVGDDEVPLADRIRSPALNPEQQTAINRLAQDFFECWARLTEHDHELLLLWYRADWPIKRIAEQEGVAWRAVNNKIARARTKLHACLTSKGHDIAK